MTMEPGACPRMHRHPEMETNMAFLWPESQRPKECLRFRNERVPSRVKERQEGSVTWTSKKSCNAIFSMSESCPASPASGRFFFSRFSADSVCRRFSSSCFACDANRALTPSTTACRHILDSLSLPHVSLWLGFRSPVALVVSWKP